MSESIYTTENGLYLKKHPSWHVEDSAWKASQILKMLTRNPINPQSVIEVGCGAGEILNQLYLHMPPVVEFTGYDISPDAINLARPREKQRLTFKHEDFVRKDHTCDLMLMIDVFEHVEDPLGFLRSCKNKAAYAIFHIPLDISALSIIRNKLILKRNTVGHLHYYTKETAIATLVDAGYQIMDFFYTPGSLELPFRSLKSKTAALPRKLLFSINQDFAVKTLGGFSLLVLAKAKNA